MRKRFLAVVLTCAMAVSMIAGCGTKETNVEGEGQVEATVAPTKAPSKDDAAVGGFDDSSTTEPTVAPAEPTVEPTVEPTIAPTEAPAVPVEYTVEMLEQSIPVENLMVGISGTESGSSFLMEVGSYGNDFIFAVKAENEANELFTEMSFYTVGGSIYSKQSDGTTVVYKKAVLSTPDVDGSGMAMSAEDSMGVDFETIVGVEYLRTETIDGVTYDVVRADTETYPEGAFVPADGVVMTDPETGEEIKAPEPVIEPLFFYINKATNMCEFFLSSDVATGVNNGDYRADFSVLTEVALPEDFATATYTEVSEQDMAMDMFGCIFMFSAVMSGVDMSGEPMNTPVE